MKLHYLFIFITTSLFTFILLDMFMRHLLEAIELQGNPRYEELRRFVEPKRLVVKRVLGGLSAACVAFIVQLMCGVEKMVIGIPVAIAFGILFWELIYLYYRRKMQKRNEAFEGKILDFAMGLSSGLKSGLSIGQALSSITHRIGGPMQEELEILLHENHLNVDLPEAFEHLYERMPFEDIQILSTAVALSIRSGGSLSEVLEEIVDVIRARMEFQGRLKNMTAQGRFEAIVISCAPLASFIVLYIVDPNLMRPVVTTGFGWLAVAGAMFLVGIGYYVLRKLITIDV